MPTGGRGPRHRTRVNPKEGPGTKRQEKSGVGIPENGKNEQLKERPGVLGRHAGKVEKKTVKKGVGTWQLLKKNTSQGGESPSFWVIAKKCRCLKGGEGKRGDRGGSKSNGGGWEKGGRGEDSGPKNGISQEQC